MIFMNVEKRNDFVHKHFKDRISEWENLYKNDKSNNHFIQRMREVLSQLEKYCPARETRFIADIGCGNGAYLSALCKLPGSGVGIDFVSEMVELTKAKINGKQGWDAVQGSALKLPFKTSTFDAITAAGLIEYFDCPEEVLCEFKRVLKPNGIAVVTFPNKYAWQRIGKLPFSFGRYMKISFKLKLANLLCKIRGKTLDPSSFSLNEFFGHIKIRKIARQAVLIVETIDTVGFSTWPLFGFKVLPSKIESSMSCLAEKRKNKFPWRFLGSDLVVVFRKKSF